MADARQAIVSWAHIAVANKSKFIYDEIRPIQLNWNAPIKNDCSGTVTLFYYSAGAPDPNSLSYDGYGNTDTLADHGTLIDNPEPGDLVIYFASDTYSPGNTVHTAVVVESGPDPLTVSHGSSSEPAYIRVSQDNRPHKFYRYNTTLIFPEHVPGASKPPPEATKMYTTSVSFRLCEYNDNNNYVRKIQALLVANGFASQIDGKFGPATRDAVIKFQQSHNVKEHAVVGAETLSELLKA